MSPQPLPRNFKEAAYARKKNTEYLRWYGTLDNKDTITLALPLWPSQLMIDTHFYSFYNLRIWRTVGSQLGPITTAIYANWHQALKVREKDTVCSL